MSIDFKIENTCDHLIHYEQVAIDEDLKIIRIPRTLSSSNVTLNINGYDISSNHSKFGWTLENDTDFIYTKRSKIIFKNKRKSLTDFYFVSYSSVPKFCPKCKGLRIHNDFSYNALGKLKTVANEDKLLQEIKKGLTTELGSNPFHTWIGTQIYTLIGSKIYNVSLLRARLIDEINKYIEKYIDVQIKQSSYQDVTDRELFGQLLSIDVEPQDDIDPSYWIVSIIFSNKTGADLLYEKKIDIPGPKNLLYGSQKPNIST